MPSSFNVREAAGYEQLMGRWSRKLAPLLIDFAGLADGENVLDVGCGTGSLTFALAAVADLRQIVAIDYSPVFVEEAAQAGGRLRLAFRGGARSTARWRCSSSTSCRSRTRQFPKCGASCVLGAWSRPPFGIISAACLECG